MTHHIIHEQLMNYNIHGIQLQTDPFNVFNTSDSARQDFYCGPRQANLVLNAYASSEGSGEPAHPRSLARTSTARSYKQ